MTKDPKLMEVLDDPSTKPLSDEDMIIALQRAGYRVTKDNPAAERRATVLPGFEERWSGGQVVRFGVISCTHLGSRQQQLDALEAFYTRIAQERISTVLHGGDVSEGDGRVYKGQEFDLLIHGADQQRRYIVENYPRRDGVTTYMIAGNHDWSHWQRGGIDILAGVAAERSDMKYLGPMGAKVIVGGIHVYIAHGMGGGSYARTYKIQRRIEQFAPEEKPEIYLLGHYHTWAHVPMYRNVEAWTLGCFQSQTDFLKRMGVYPEIGGLILTIYKGTKGADRPGGFVRVISEIVPFYVPTSALKFGAAHE